MSAQVADVLERARALMNDGGKHWIKDELWTFKQGEVCYCSVGAIHAATKSDRLRERAVRALALVIPPHPSRHSFHSERVVIAWNDARTRRWTDVDATFKAAADKARGPA